VSAEIAVQLAWSPRARDLRIVELRLPAGATVAAALGASGMPELAAAAQDEAALAAAGLLVAVCNRARPLDHALRDGDRVEVLRGLQIDPMSARRVRFEAAGGIDALRRRGYAGRKR
jgi:putative ubiquitin-RnfH superfamily antitoxin RatB of RatAB toxin-antitoxin module